jgi:choline dehydrogenase
MKAYDYVIVGAGSAGCVLAARLTENPHVRVALIEAGSADYASQIAIPIAALQLFKSKFDWDYRSEPEPGLGRRPVYVPRGKTLGGSSSINAMVYQRGNRGDYDEWARLGAAGWSYAELLPYFIRSEGNERGDENFHGRHGPLTVRDSRSQQPYFDWFIQAAIQAGYPTNEDFNGPSQIGIGHYQFTQRNGARCSAAVAYLHPALERSNLTVITNALVTRVVLEGIRAIGVAIDRDGVEEILLANQEVLLSAGSYNSPQLLMLSGIGPAEHLRQLGLLVTADLPVGEGLQDHPLVPIEYLTNERTLRFAGSAEDVALFQSEGRGALTSNGLEAGGFLSTQGHQTLPDVQLYFGAAMYDDAGLMNPYDDAIGIGVNLLKPTSRGRLTLRSARPDSKPRILFNYYTTPEDRRTMIDGIKIALEILGQPVLQDRLRAPYLVPDSSREQDIWSFIQRNAGTVHHPTSTCAIGKVVDVHLKVFGVEGLRVVDASVMPSVIRGNTNAAVIAIAEKAAELLNADRAK